MRPILYYVPNETGMPGPGPARDQWLQRCGLKHLLGCSFPIRRTVGGPTPENCPGVVLSGIPPNKEADRLFEVGYRPCHNNLQREETWREAAGHWIGFAHEYQPGPDDLVRDTRINGHLVKLRDGNEWLFPAVRLAGGRSGLPQAIGLDARGDLIIEDLPEYADVQDGARLCYDHYMAGEGFTYVQIVKLLSRILGLNYYVSAAETSALKLFDTENILRAMWAIIDGPTIKRIIEDEETSKKKEKSTLTGDSPNTGSIVEAAFQDTGQPMQTSGYIVSDGAASNG